MQIGPHGAKNAPWRNVNMQLPVTLLFNEISRNTDAYSDGFEATRDKQTMSLLATTATPPASQRLTINIKIGVADLKQTLSGRRVRRENLGLRPRKPRLLPMTITGSPL